jgi:CRISPR-associated DxTHG motif protein
MALTIINKKNIQKKQTNKKIAIVTILGTLNKSTAYYFKDESLDISQIKVGDYENMLPLLYDSYKDTPDISIIPIYTVEALKAQQELIPDFSLKDAGFEIDEENFDAIFYTINQILADEKYDEFIVDITHGFRHLPILATVSMIINNFQNASRISHILFAKEIEKYKKYEIIDLKNYLEIANISFVLNTFDDNYTVANHIKSKKYNTLIIALNDFSNDIMALNLSNLNESSLPNLIQELDKIQDGSIKTMAQELKKNLLVDFVFEEKRYLTFYKISKNLLEKNYILPSLSLLYESIRIYLKTAIKQDYPMIVQKIEKYFDDDLYKIGDFFKNLGKEKQTFNDLKEGGLQKIITEQEYKKLQERFPHRMSTPALMKEIMNTRNDLSHANSKEKFSTIKQNASDLVNRFAKQYKIEEKLIK